MWSLHPPSCAVPATQLGAVVTFHQYKAVLESCQQKAEEDGRELGAEEGVMMALGEMGSGMWGMVQVLVDVVNMAEEDGVLQTIKQLLQAE